jgi:uncharacterized repeat protein (TIGR02543 family)
MKKHILLFVIAVLSCLQLSAQSSNNASPKHEFRATWFATVTNIDWPTAPNLTVAQQKAELIAILDKLQAGNINAVCLQVRSQGDALYKSSYEPWAVALTGTRGKDPGYDPLEYAIQEAHNRGMELHAWVNPFRMSTTEGGRLTEAQVNDLYTGLSWKWVLTYDNGTFTGQIIDPGYPAAREYIKNVVMEIVDKYDIDGILMDDYFYPYGGTTDEDAVSKGLHKPNDVKDINGDGHTDDDWRRSNVDALVKMIYDELNTGANKKPWVRFGLAPFGVWTVQPKAAAAYGISLPNGISGQDCYEQLACNPIEWIKNGYIDYVSPQLYWPTATSPNDYRRAQDYHILYNWWSDICTQFSKELPGDQVVQFYPSHSADRVYDSHQWGANEMRTQVGYNQKKLTHGYSGSVFFSTRFYLNLKNAKDEYVCGTLDSTLCEQLHASHYQHKALVPPMAWKSTEELDAPNTLRINGKTLTWAHDNAERFTVYIYPKGVRCNQAVEDVNYLQGVVYGKSFTLPNSFDITTHNVAVRAYDRYAVEHAPAEYGPDVTYVLNGGLVKYEAQITVPTNEELWEQFKTAFNEFNGLNKVDQPITNCGAFTYTNSGTPCLDMLTSAESGWKWLGDYLVKTATAAGKTCATNAAFRWNLDAFFNAYAGKNDALGVDYTTAGQPSAWGPAYLAAHSNTNVEPQPTNAELWTSFKPYYNAYYGLSRADQTIENVASFAAAYMQDIMTNANSEYKWLGDYISSVVSAQGKAALTTENAWRWAVHAFFNCYDGTVQGTQLVATANFSTAGQPAAWKAAWDAAHTTSADPETSAYTLPDFIETALTLPTEDSRPVYITHPNEYTFAGWIDSNGNSIETLPINYKGTVYAQWNSPIKWVLNGGAYTGHHELPLTVDEEYYLPTAFAMRKEGYKFAGWYDNASFTGEVITTIPANYTGTLYAKWGEATHVTWHPYPYYDVTNEDLWELFMEDYNAFYQNRDILGEKVSSGAKSYQPMTGAFGFTFSVAADKEKDGFRDGRLKDFMTHPKSPWRWLGDYITEVLEEENESLDSNAPLWTSFKEATGLTGLGALKDMTFATICGTGALDTDNTDGKTGETILAELFAQPEWEWLRDYLIKIHTEQKNNSKVCDDGISRTPVQLTTDIAATSKEWRYAIAAFFLQTQHKVQWPLTADFSTAGKHSVWKDIIPEEYHDLGHFRITNELEWRKTVAAFFNHTNVLTYTLNSGVSKTEGTADFRNLGLPKPNGDPAAGWYSAWWNATFPEYMMDNEALPKIKRKNYVFGGWYYGNDKGYIFTEGTKANPAAYSSANDDYKNHLWGRWLELCLYEGYVDSDPAALDANEQPISPKVNNNVEMVICNAEEIDRTKLSRKVDVERKLIGGTYNTLFLPFGINGDPKMDKTIDGKTHFLSQVVDDNGNPLLNPETTSILVYDNAVVENIGGEEVIAYNFHEYAQEDQFEILAPYTPFLIKPENDITVRMHFWAALMRKPATPKARTDANQVFVEGVLAPTMLPINPEHDNTLILVADNRLAKVTTQGEMLGLRLYFTVPKDVSPSARSIIRVNNAPAGIDDIETPQQGASAIKIMQNGQIYILRGDEVYTIMGNRVK